MTVGTAFILGYFVGAICFFVSWRIAKKVIKKSEVKKQPFNNYHSKEEQELNLHNALTDYCDM